MKDRKIAQQIAESFDNIRSDVLKMQRKVDSLIGQAQKKYFQNREMYSPEYLERVRSQEFETIESEVSALKERTLLTAHGEIANIRFLLDAWMSLPVPNEVSNLLRTFADLGLKPTVREIDMLQDRASGSYLAERVIDEYARDVGVDTGFISIEELERRLNAVDHDVATAIRAYTGKLNNDFSFTAQTIGLGVSPELLKDFWVFAESYFDRDDSTFELLRKDLALTTETEFSIRPRMRQHLDEIFEDADESARLSIAVSLIREGSSLADLLPLYDSKLSELAKSQIVEDARRETIERATESQKAFKALSHAQHAEQRIEKRLT